jgi:ABC-type Fe3+-siderophore transport system permease subunit
MELYHLLVFAIIGALSMFIITGGFLAMTGADPSTSSLSAGAAIGAALGSATSYLTGAEKTLDPTQIISTLSGGVPEMKVGLPGF